MTKASEDCREQWERRERMWVKLKKKYFLQCIIFSIPLTIIVFTIQGLPGIDGKDGTPGIPGIKVWGTMMLHFLNV